MRPALPQGIAMSGLRVVIVIVTAALLTTTVWICLMAGMVLALRPVLGTAGAFLTVGGGLSILALLVIAALSASGTKTPTRSAAVRDEAIAIAMTALQSRRGRQVALGAVGALLLVAAALMSASSETDPE